MIRLLILALLLPNSNAFQAKVCDCAKAKPVGLLQFADVNCRPPAVTNWGNVVEYSIFTTHPAAAIFPAYVCGRWKIIKHITMNFWGQTISVPDKIAIDTTPEECRIMQQSKRCGSVQMTIQDDKWIHNQEPEDVGYWLRTVETHSIGCMLEEIRLSHEVDATRINTPIGIVNVSTGYYSHNHLTIVWDAKFATKVDPRHRKLEEGRATISNSSTPGIFLFEDHTKQLAYHVYAVQRCLEYGCTNKSDAFAIIKTPELYITARVIPRKPEKPFVGRARDGPIIANTTAAFNVELNGRLQYIKDQMTTQENELVRVIHTLQCEVRKAKHAQAISTAQYNGWLAATQLKLPICTKLSACGETLAALKCETKTVNFATELTKCGPQPRFGNFTINLDGWELVPYSPCYWTTGYVNFNGDPFAYRNNTWTRIEPEIMIPQTDLATAFRYEDVNFFEYQPRSNPAYTDASLGHMNILADIVASMNEHAPVDFPGDPKLTHSTTTVLVKAIEKTETAASKQTTFSNFWEKLKILSFLSILGTATAIIIRYCYTYGIFSMIWKLLCKLRKPQPHRNSEEIEMQEFHHTEP